MARPTQYQKLSLQLDAENKKLKAKLAQSKTQINSLKGSAKGLSTGFGKSFDQIGGKAGMLKSQFTGLLNNVMSMHPAVLGLAAAGGALALAFKDLTAYTSSWEGALSDAGRQMASLELGATSFWKRASQERGKALAEGGVFGWIGETVDQLHGLTTGVTVAALAVQTGVASVVNDAMLSWQEGTLKTTVETTKLRAETQALYNQFRDKALLPEERLKAVDEYKAKALKLYQIQKQNADRELKFLEQEAILAGNSYEDNLKIEQKKAEIYTLEKEYLRLVGRSLEYNNSINAELDKQVEKSKEFAKEIENIISNFETFKDIPSLSDLFGDSEPPPWLEDMGVGKLLDQYPEVADAMDEYTSKIQMAQFALKELREAEREAAGEEVVEGYLNLASIVGSMANGIANAKDNWAALGAVALSGFARIGGAIQKQLALIETLKEAKKAELIANQAVGVSEAVKSGAGIPFPGNLVAIATGVATVLSTIAPFIGSFAKGTDFVPKTGMAMIHKGEAIIPAAQNRRGGGRLMAVVSGTDLKFILDEENRKTQNTF